MNKYLVILVATSFLGVSCNSKYKQGFNAGYDEGYTEGKDETYQTGYNDGLASGQADGYNTGYTNGNNDGYNAGWNQAYNDFASEDYLAGEAQGLVSGYNNGYDVGYTGGFADGKADGLNDGFNDGYNNGYNNGYALGDSDGYSDGYNHGYADGMYDGTGDGYGIGYNDGYSDGEYDGYNSGYNHGYADAGNTGYDQGFNDGYDDYYDSGYNQGFDDGYDYGLGNSSSNPSIKLANQVNKDLINYASLPKFDSKSVLESGTIVFSRNDSGSVDMEKLAALKEQFYLNAMKDQIQRNFGLSSETSMRVATVAHQYNKLGSSRALTEKDASTFSNELIGFDMNAIEGAVKKSARGESSELNALLDKASEKLGTTPENFNKIISKIFY